jgi:transcriptional pleiotropic repressor
MIYITERQLIELITKNMADENSAFPFASKIARQAAELYGRHDTVRSDAAKQSVKKAMDALTHSELTAVLAIFDGFGHEGITIAAKVAETAGVTRTAAANALRKLAGAGVIETRSLGAKGTYIKVLNLEFGGEYKKYL